MGSYVFDATTDYIGNDTGWSVGVNVPCTLLVWMYWTDGIAGYEYPAIMNNSLASANHSLGMRTTITADNWEAYRRDTAQTVRGLTEADSTRDSAWFPVMCRFVGSQETRIHVGTEANTGGSNLTSSTFNNMLYITIGNAYTRTSGYSSATEVLYVAGAALWSVDISSQTDRQNLMDNKYLPTRVQESNIVAWWDMRSNRDAEGTILDSSISGDGESLTISGATYSTDAGDPALNEGATASLYLYDKTGADQASLSSVSWSWFDANPSAGASATDAGTAQVTDSNGQMVLSISNSTLTSGQSGWLLLYDSTGSKVGTYNVAVD